MDSLQTNSQLEHSNLSSLRGIAKPKTTSTSTSTETNNKEDYITYLVKKYR